MSSPFGRKCGRCQTNVCWKGDDGMDGAVVQAVVRLLTNYNTLFDVGSMVPIVLSTGC